jgi:hypothetical protein
MMANATRDPIFQAALTIANQDLPGSGELCIRCHSPRGFLFERHDPPDLSRLEVDDFEGVSCDFCHRLQAGPDGTVVVGSGQYWVGDDFVRRGPIADPQAPHDAEYSALFTQSNLCGICHDVSNPYQDGFAIERTFSEWSQSDFAAEGTTCQSCHMPAQEGYACGAPDVPVREVHRHELVGGHLVRWSWPANTPAGARTLITPPVRMRADVAQPQPVDVLAEAASGDPRLCGARREFDRPQASHGISRRPAVLVVGAGDRRRRVCGF